MGTAPPTNMTNRPNLADTQAAVREFLGDFLCDVRRVDVTEVSPSSSSDAVWEAEVEVWQINPTLKLLGVEAGRPVLDHTSYRVRLDDMLNILGYELSDLSELHRRLEAGEIDDKDFDQAH